MIICAIYVFDQNSFNKICVSFILALNAINAFIYSSMSENVRAKSKLVSWSMYIIIIILLAKILFVGF